MSDLLLPLRELQALDQQLLDLRRRRKEAPLTLQKREKVLAESEAALAAEQEAQKRLKLQVREIEASLQGKDALIEKLTIQSNQAKTNVEFQAFRKEIGGAKADRASLEDRGLEIYEQMEEQERRLAEIRVRIGNEQRAIEDLRIEIENRLGSLEQQSAELEARRSAHTDQIPSDHLTSYQRLFEHKEDGKAMAAVEEETCRGCFHPLTPQLFTDLLSGRKIVYCPSCSRILYLV